jgi:hypothetical protein
MKQQLLLLKTSLFSRSIKDSKAHQFEREPAFQRRNCLPPAVVTLMCAPSTVTASMERDHTSYQLTMKTEMHQNVEILDQRILNRS